MHLTFVPDDSMTQFPGPGDAGNTAAAAETGPSLFTALQEQLGLRLESSGAQQNSLDALRQASDTSYFKDKDALWVKAVSNGDPGNGAPGGGTSVQVSR